MDRTTNLKSNEEIEDLNHSINQPDLTDTYKTFPTKTAD